MKLNIHSSHFRRFESLTALLVGAFLATLGGWAQVRYSGLEDRIAAWRLVGEEIRVNQELLTNHRTLGRLMASDVSPTRETRYNILIPSMVLMRGYDVVTEKGLQDLSPADLGVVAAYYLDLRTLNERIQMLQNFLVYGTIHDTDQQLMPLLMRHYNSVASAAETPYERVKIVAPLVDSIVHRLDAKRRHLREAFVISASLAALTFLFVLIFGVAGFVIDVKEKAA